MWIGDIDVPQPVLDAAEAGELVLFVGAGASRAQPSGLPDFAQLVRNIGALVGREPTAHEVQHPDVFLGRLQDNGNDVHQLVASAIDQPGSLPNALHQAIAGLTAAYPNPKIVTTNYDRHLTSAAAALSHELDVYKAPALPVGDDFEGVVYLHGSLSQSRRRLVVTDTDFGRAYLREAWAARFLDRMFSAFTTVFIGYSHGDVVMQYLARSLGPDQNRYVLTADSKNAEWRRLGLKPIEYPNDAGDHSALPASLDRWRALATMGHVEHRARIAALTSAEPPTIPEEVSYIEAVLAHPERVRYFAEKARFDEVDRSRRWFEWFEGRAGFLALFSPDSTGDLTVRVLMSWIADQFILSEENSGVALRAFREKLWPPDMWYAIAQALFAHQGDFPKWLNPWLALVLQNAPSRQHDLIDMMLVDKDWSTNFDVALMVFEDRTRPHLKRAFEYGAPSDQPRFEVDLCGDEHWLTDNWEKIFVPVLDQHFAHILGLTTEQIARVYRTLRGVDPGGTFDPVSFSRSAIEHHQQDSHRSPIDALVDAARDSIEVALSHDLPLGVGYLQIWSRSPHTILRRLAVHGWRVRTDLSSDEKLIWLLGQDILWDWPLQHEVFRLIRDALPTATGDVARPLVDAAIAGPPGDDDEHSSYRSFNLLGWLADSAPDLQIAGTAFEQSQAAHPEYGRREHPDLNHYGSVGFVEDAIPFTATELHELVAQDPAAALTRLRQFQTVAHALSGPTWTGALRSLQACVTTHPRDGVQVAAVLQEDDRDIRASIIYGWDGAALDYPLIEQTLKIISGWDSEEIRRPASSMLSNGGDPEHPTKWHEHETARRLASDLWPTDDVGGAIIGGTDLVLEAINHPAGDLAQFWTKVVQWEWAENQATWEGLPQVVATELDRMVSTANRNGLLARTFLGSQLHFFFGADREWCESRLLPQFDWTTNHAEAAAAWQGFLTWGRWNDGLLQAGLLDAYMAAAAHAEELPSNIRRQLAGHLTSIAMFAPNAPDTWLTRFVVGASEELRISWAHEVKRALTQLECDDVLGQWDRWIRAYWTGRNQSVPLPFTPAEASATAGWVIGLPGVRKQAIDLVLGSEAGLEQHGGFLYRLTDLDIPAEANDWARFLTHLLKHTTGNQWAIGRRLQEIVPKLRKGDPPPDLKELINQAMRLGATNAADW